MRVDPLGGQLCPLGNAESVLFVGDDEAQPLKGNPLGQQGMGSY